MNRTGLIFLLLAFTPVLIAQESFKISKPEASFSDNTLIIKYDITGCGSGEFVDINLVLLNSRGDTLKPGYISGDIGLRINCGFGKTIVWDLARDNFKIDEDIQIIVTGSKSAPVGPSYIAVEEKKITKGSILLSSVFVPGLGQKRISGKSGYFVFSGLVYGSLGASAYFNFIRSKKLKNDYLAAYGTERDIMFDKWEKSYDISKYLAFGAAGIWAVNFIWSAAMPVKENPNKRMDLSLITFSKNDLLVSAKWTF